MVSDYEPSLDCDGHIPGPGFVQQLSPPFCQTLELGLDLFPVQSVGSGSDPLPLGTDHLYRWPTVIQQPLQKLEEETLSF